MRRFKKILVVCQEDSRPELAIERARALAKANDAAVTQLDVVDIDHRELASIFFNVSDGLSDVVPSFAHKNKVDLVVMGTVSRTDVAGLFIGSTAEVILNRLNCSVLSVKPPHFRTPVDLSDEPDHLRVALGANG